MNKKAPDPEKLKMRMASLCARSEQCVYDISLKLRRAGLNSQETESIIKFLIDNRFLSDERFAVHFASYKTRFSGWGRYKIQQALKAKRINSSLIQKAVEEIDPKDSEEALSRALANKAKSLDLTKKEDAMKLYRHLMGRGFESDRVLPEIKSLIKKARSSQSDD